MRRTYPDAAGKDWRHSTSQAAVMIHFDTDIKRGIAKFCVLQATKKSCQHRMSQSIYMQTERSRKSGFSKWGLGGSGGILPEGYKQPQQIERKEKNKNPVDVLQYMHTIAHR